MSLVLHNQDLKDNLELQANRAKEVFTTIKGIKTHLSDNLLTLGELLSEARSNGYAELMGYDSFGSYLEATELDMSERQAYYLIKIIDNSRTLGITRDELKASKMSKLKEIFSLDPAVHGNDIKQLVAESADSKLEEVKAAVERIRSDGKTEATTWRNFRVTESQAQVIDQAIEQVKEDYGDVVNGSTGEIENVSDSRAFELICIEYTNTNQHNLR
jgi:hypothetical protein